MSFYLHNLPGHNFFTNENYNSVCNGYVNMCCDWSMEVLLSPAFLGNYDRPTDQHTDMRVHREVTTPVQEIFRYIFNIQQ